MKKMLMLIALLFMFTIVLGESVILNDGRTLKGEIIGKKGDQIYLDSEGNIYLIRRDLVQEIKNEGNQPITGLIYRKKDFMQNWVGSQEIIELISKTKEDLSVFTPGKLTKEGINEMTDREFQLYLTQLQVNEINGVRKTMWSIWGTSFGVSVGLTAIVFLIAGN